MAELTTQTYGGHTIVVHPTMAHSVVISRGHKYYVLSKHRTKFNARRQLKRIDLPAKILKVGDWWVVAQGLPRQYQ